MSALAPVPPSPPELLLRLIERTGIDATFVAPGVPMPSVPAAAAAIGVSPDLILKSLLFQGGDGRFVLAIASGLDRVDRRLLAGATGIADPRMADPATVLRVTGYPAGGVAPIGHRSPLAVVVDRRTAALAEGYGGGGRPELLLRIRIADVIRLTGADVADLVAAPEADRR